MFTEETVKQGCGISQLLFFFSATISPSLGVTSSRQELKKREQKLDNNSNNNINSNSLPDRLPDCHSLPDIWCVCGKQSVEKLIETLEE